MYLNIKKILLLICFAIFFFHCKNNKIEKNKINSEYKEIIFTYAKNIKIYKNLFGYKVLICNQKNIIDSFYISDSNINNIGNIRNIDISKNPKFISISSSDIAYFDTLQSLHKLYSIPYTNKISEKCKMNNILDNKFFLKLNKEKLILEKNNIQIINSNITETNFLNKYNIKYITAIDYLENDPLGRAEWIKFFGIITNKYKEAVEIFNNIEQEYLKIKKKVVINKHNKNHVILGEIYNGFWYLPDDKSYIINIVKDAGFEYIDIDYDVKNNIIEFEKLYLISNKIDYWFYTTSSHNININKDDILLSNQKYQHLPFVSKTNIFINNTYSNEYFEYSNLYPDKLLADFHNINSNNYKNNIYFKLIK